MGLRRGAGVCGQRGWVTLLLRIGGGTCAAAPFRFILAAAVTGPFLHGFVLMVLRMPAGWCMLP